MVISRNGYDDKVSQGIIHQLETMGVHVDLVRGGVTDIGDVRRVFSSAAKPIAGIIQRAMVLRVRSNCGLDLVRTGTNQYRTRPSLP